MKVPHFFCIGLISDVVAKARAEADAADARALLALIALLIISRLTY